MKKPPLCKGRWHGASREVGIDRTNCKLEVSNPSVSYADSSLYTREPKQIIII